MEKKEVKKWQDEEALKRYRIPFHLLFTKPRVIQVPLHRGLLQHARMRPSFQLQHLYDLTHAPLRDFAP